MSLRSAALAVAGFALACSQPDTRRSASAERAGTTASPTSKLIALADPAQAAAQFVNARVKGEGLTTDTCLGRDTIRCGAAAVIDSVAVDATARVRGDTARVVAHYVEIGSLAQGPGALRYLPIRDVSARARSDTLVLARDAGGWRVVRLDQRTRIHASLAMYYFDLADHGRDSIARDASLSWSSVVRPVLTEPARLTQVPEAIRDTLKARGCRVLQSRGQSSDNALHGALFGTGGDDWVFLCATRSADAVILVFPGVGGTPTDLPNIGGAIPDVDALPEPDNAGRIYGCAPRTGLVPAEMMKLLVHTGRLVTEVGVDTLSASERRLTVHDGIVSSDCEGVSNVHYWTGRRWVRFAGAD